MQADDCGRETLLAGALAAGAETSPPRPRRWDSQMPSIAKPIAATISSSTNAIQAIVSPSLAT